MRAKSPEIHDEDVLAEIVRRIVRVAAPEQILLFGSAARGEADDNSDLDLLVIKSGAFHRGLLTEEIYMSLIGVGRAVDIIVATPEDIDRYRDSPALVFAPALREGRIIHAA
jgi:predicted nucleotidyltransferase